MADRFEIPQFVDESEEAQWWFDHQNELMNAFEGAGELGIGSAAAHLSNDVSGIQGSAAVIRLDPRDTSRARKLAIQQGVHVETYLEKLLHDALLAEEKGLGS